jgi:hypothetical protein
VASRRRVTPPIDGTPATVCATVSPTSRAVSGAYYFAPSLDVLNELAGPDVDR